MAGQGMVRVRADGMQIISRETMQAGDNFRISKGADVCGTGGATPAIADAKVDAGEVRWFRYVRHAQVEAREAEGWQVADDLSGCHHGVYSVLMEHTSYESQE